MLVEYFLWQLSLVLWLLSNYRRVPKRGHRFEVQHICLACFFLQGFGSSLVRKLCFLVLFSHDLSFGKLSIDVFDAVF